MQTITVNSEVKVPSTAVRDPETGLVLEGQPPETPECGFWPVFLVDGEPVDPFVAISKLVRGEASYDVANIDADASALREFKRAARPRDFRRYDSVLTAGAKLEVARLRAEVEGLPVFVFESRDRYDVADLARVFRVDETTLRTRFASQKFAAAVYDEATGRWLVEAVSVRRCVDHDTTVVDPLPNRKSPAKGRSAA